MRRFFDQAIGKWHLRGLGRSLAAFASPAIAYGVLATAVLIALCAYIATPVEPFGFTGDLGFSHETVAGAVYTIHSPTDVLDTIGWTPWFNFPLFYLNSNASEALLTVVTWLSGDAWLAIKIVQVLEVIVSIGASFAMYATYGGRRSWALVFGLTYAALPITALAIRGNLAMGWLAALAPAAIAAGTSLLRKYGARSVPLIGFLCGAVGYGIALEYAAFISIPLLALILAGGRPRLALIDWVTFVPLGLLCCVAMGAFYVLPSFVAPVVSDAAARSATLVRGAFLDNFSQTWPGLLTLVTRESYVSPYPEYDAGPAMPNLYAFGAIVWFAAVANLVKSKRRLAGWADPLSILIVAGCIVLAMGSALPFGQALWNGLFAIPHLNAIRTTDRFFTVPALFVTFWYVCTLERITQAGPARIRAGGWLALAILFAFVVFDVSQHCFTVDPSKGSRQPQIDSVRRVVEAQGGRTTSFAGVNGGASFESSSEYGIPVPTTPAAQDLGWRYIEDGNGSAGVIGRTGVHTIVSAPAWTGALDFPNTSAIYRHLPNAPVIFRSAEDVLVATVTARDDVSTQTPVCVHGGPGGFDLLESTQGLAQTAFLERPENCRLSGFLNFDPRDLWLQRPGAEAWAGRKLLITGRSVADNDYPFLPNRSLLNIPWYRNSIDGDRPLFDASGAIEVMDPRIAVLSQHGDWPAGSVVAIRLDSRNGGEIDVSAGDVALGIVHVDPARGFRWYELRTTRRVLAATAVSFNLQPASKDTQAMWNGFALDGVAVLPPAATAPSLKTRPAFVAVSLDRLERQKPSSHDDLVFTPSVAGGAATTNVYVDTIAQSQAWLADAAHSQLRLTWNGRPGLYVVNVKAVLNKPGDTLGIDANQIGTCCRSSVTYTADYSGGLADRFQLRPGSKIVVTLDSPSFYAHYINRIITVDVKRVGPLAFITDSAMGHTATIDFAKPYDALTQLSTVSQIAFKSALAFGQSGSDLETTARLSGHPRSVSLEINKVGLGSATATLECNGASPREVALREDYTALALSGPAFTRCSTRIHWTTGDLAIQSLRLIAGAGAVPPSATDLWLPAGSYRASIVNADATVMRRPPLRSAGCRGSEPVCTFRADGYHRIALGESPGAGRLLMFQSLRHVAAPAAIDVKHVAALRWDVLLLKTATVELTQIYDGNWIITDGTHTYQGERCDITNTCFSDVSAGHYRLYHRWPRSLRVGILITLGSLGLGILVLLLPLPRTPLRTVNAGRNRS